MAIAITEEHQEIARVARKFLSDHQVRAASRATLEAGEDSLPPFWKELVELGWLSIHLPEAYGGTGFGLPELVIIVEELGYQLAPGPFLPTVWASAFISQVADDAVQSALLPSLADGSMPGAVGLGGNLSLSGSTLNGKSGLVLGAELANKVLLRAGDDMVLLDAKQQGLTLAKKGNMDTSRRVGEFVAKDVSVEAAHIFKGAYREALRLGRTLAAAEASGGAHACVKMAVDYAMIREQFGRTIATFQAVKHHCANMIMAAECATAAAWDAARAEQENKQAEFASVIAASLAMPAFVFCGQMNTQVHGGIGFTWEHDCHLYIRRAQALNALFSGAKAKEEIVDLSAQNIKRSYKIELPPEAEAYRSEVQAFVRQLESVKQSEQRKFLADSGYLVPHWPKPWGLAAGAIEQLVIDQEFSKTNVPIPNLGISGWNTLTIAQHGNDYHKEKYVRPALQGDMEFCQLFSEPNAGSDAAAVQTKAKKVDGGWIVNGQKVWTSGAHYCSHGFATVKTDFQAAKHQAITMMIIDMKAKGVEVKPLRQVTGQAMFNEVFFNDVFVPDEDVVGPINQGWTVARATLGNERVSIGGGMGVGNFLNGSPLTLMQRFTPDDLGIKREVGQLTAMEVAARLMNLRSAERAVQSIEPGPEGNITKFLGSELALNSAELSSRIIGEGAATFDNEAAMVNMMFLAARALAIAGGTSEIARNQIAERILGMPRDPLIK